MSKDLTIKVNYVLGDTSAFQQAGQQADQLSRNAQNNMRTETATAVASQQQLINGVRAYNVQVGAAGAGAPKGMLGGFLQGGIGGMMKGAGLAGALGLAAYGAIGTGASDYASISSGGPFLRGHGFAGMADSMYGFLSGRGTREALEDFKLGRGDLNASRYGQMLSTQREADSAAREGMFRPITEINPLRRQEAERNMLSRQLRTLRDQERKAVDGVNIDIGLDNLGKGRIGSMRVGGEIDNINHLKMQVQLQDDIIARNREMVDIRKQQVQFETDALMQRKQSLHSDATRYATMSPEERMEAVSAGQRLSAGQPLTPDDIGTLSQFGGARNKLDAYLRKQAEGDGYSGFMGLVGDEKLKGAINQASGGLGVSVTIEKIEQALDEQKLGDAMWKAMQRDSEDSVNKIKVAGRVKIELEQKLHRLQEQRKVVVGTNLD